MSSRIVFIPIHEPEHWSGLEYNTPTERNAFVWGIESAMLHFCNEDYLITSEPDKIVSEFPEALSENTSAGEARNWLIGDEV